MGLAPELWPTRHRGIIALLWAHAALLPIFALVRGFQPDHVLLESAVIPIIAFAASWTRLTPRLRSTIAAVGLITCSAFVTHLSGGYIEAHFHFFVMVAVITLYQDWVPFLLAILYVAVHHGLVGSIDPNSVYNHPDAVANPWFWAGVHAFFILALSAACITIWRANELGQQKLHLNQKQLAQAQEVAHLGSWTWSLSDNRVEWSDELYRLFGRAPGTFTPTFETFMQLVHPDDRQRVSDAVQATLDTGKPFEYEARVSRPDGSYRWILARGAMNADDGEQGGKMFGIALDVTDRRAAEDARLQLADHNRELERLREVDRFKTQFLNSAAHELGTPLTPIRLQVHMLKKTAGPKASRAIEILDRNVERVSALSKDLLDAARTQTGRLELRLKEINIEDLVREIVDSVQATAKHKGVKLRFSPSQPPPPRVMADEARMCQLLLNLVSNAIKFTPAGRTVRVSLEKTGKNVRVKVHDEGIGFQSAQATQLFQPFIRLHETTESIPGTGLGLFVCRGIVEAHGGAIWCESPGPGKGATFTFDLPSSAEPVVPRTFPSEVPLMWGTRSMAASAA